MNKRYFEIREGYDFTPRAFRGDDIAETQFLVRQRSKRTRRGKRFRRKITQKRRIKE